MRVFVVFGILGLIVTASAQMPIPFNPNATLDTLLLDSEDDISPSIWAGPDGFWAAAWDRQDDVFFTTSTDDGVTWQPPRRLYENVLDSSPYAQPSVIIKGMNAGQLMIVWAHDNTDSLEFIASNNWGDTWTQPAQIMDGNQMSGFGLESGENGTWMVVYSDERLTTTSSNTENDIYAQRSTDLGATWSPVALIHPIGAIQTGDDVKPDLATDDLGNWMVVWESQSSLNGSIVAGNNIVSAYSVDDGVTWSATYPVNSSATVEGYHDIYEPSIATDGMGRWVVLWNERVESGADNTYRIFASATDTGPADWSAQIQISIYNNRNNERPFVKYLGDGRWCAVWSYLTEITSNPSRGLAYATSVNPSVAWTDQVVTYSDFIGPHVLANSVDATTSGTMIAATTLTGIWQDPSENRYGLDDDLFFTRTGNAAQGWSDLQPLNIDAGSAPADDLNPFIASAGSTLIAAWQRNENPAGPTGGDVEIVYSRSTDSGTSWSTPQYLNDIADFTSVNDVQPKLVSGGHGIWIAAWTGSFVGPDSDLLYRRSTDDGLTWGPIAQLSVEFSGSQPSGSGVLLNDYNVDLASDGQGHLVAVWVVDVVSANSLQRFNAHVAYAYSSDNGVTWSAPALLDPRFEGSSIDSVYAPKVVYGHGAWLVSWYTTESLTKPDDTDLDVYVARSTDNGHTWSPSVPVKPNTNDVDTGLQDARPSIATDGQGDWIIAWASHDFLSGTIGFDMDILAVLSQDNGVTWTAPAPVNTDAATDEFLDGDTEGGVRAGFNGTNFFVVWCRRGPIATSPDFDIVYSSRRPEPDGPWSPPVPLNRNAATDTGFDRNVVCAPIPGTAPAPEFLAIWESNEPSGGLGTDFDLLSTTFNPAVSTGAGVWNIYE